MASKRKRVGRPRVYQNGRKEFKLCLPAELFARIEQAAERHQGTKIDISAQIRIYIERGLEQEKAA